MHRGAAFILCLLSLGLTTKALSETTAQSTQAISISLCSQAADHLTKLATQRHLPYTYALHVNDIAEPSSKTGNTCRITALHNGREIARVTYLSKNSPNKSPSQTDQLLRNYTTLPSVFPETIDNFCQGAGCS